MNDGVTGLDITSTTDAEKNFETIDTGRRSCRGNSGCYRSDFDSSLSNVGKVFQVLTKQNSTDEYHNAATDVPRLIITKFRH